LASSFKILQIKVNIAATKEHTLLAKSNFSTLLSITAHNPKLVPSTFHLHNLRDQPKACLSRHREMVEV
jgi:hypothetical protein